MRALAALALGCGLLVLSSASGCVLKADDDVSRFRGAIPASSDVKLSIPKEGSTASTKSFHTKGGDAPTSYANGSLTVERGDSEFGEILDLRMSPAFQIVDCIITMTYLIYYTGLGSARAEGRIRNQVDRKIN